MPWPEGPDGITYPSTRSTNGSGTFWKGPKLPANPAVLRLVLLVLALFAASPPAWGYGQNKVQYHQFRWHYLQTAHFDVYYSQGGELIAQFAAGRLEGMYRQVSTSVGHRLANRVPIILHNSHAEFEQTNVIRLPLHEGIGGFTEIFKNRIV